MRVTATPKPLPTRAAAAPAPAPAPKVNGIEVDMNGRVDAQSGLHATGVVHMDRVFVERLIRQVTRKTKTFGDRNIVFDAKSGTYSGTVQVKVKGHVLNLVGQVVPVTDQDQPGFQFKSIGLKLGSFTLRGSLITWLATKLIAKEITDSDIGATAAPKGVIRLNPTDLLHDIEVLPGGMHMDAGTKFAAHMTASGGIDVELKSDVAAPTGPNTPLSDLSLAVDQKAVETQLRGLLAPDYELSKVTVAPGSISLDGQVEAKPISDAVNVFKGLLAAILAGNGRPVGNVSPERAMIGLKLDAKLDGTKIALTPSLSLAVGQLQATLEKAGLKPVREGNTLKFDLGALVAPYGVQNVKAADGQLEGRAKLDINALIKAPILRGEA
jgi:hypothetical protein